MAESTPADSTVVLVAARGDQSFPVPRSVAMQSRICQAAIDPEEINAADEPPVIDVYGASNPALEFIAEFMTQTHNKRVQAPDWGRISNAGTWAPGILRDEFYEQLGDWERETITSLTNEELALYISTAELVGFPPVTALLSIELSMRLRNKTETQLRAEFDGILSEDQFTYLGSNNRFVDPDIERRRRQAGAPPTYALKFWLRVSSFVIGVWWLGPVPASNGTMDEKDRHMKRILAHVDAELENDPVLCPSRQHAVDTVREPALRALHCILVTTTVRWNRRYPDENLVTVEGVHCRGRSTALVASADGASDHSWRGKPAQMHPTKAMLQHLTTDAPSAMYFRGVVLRDRDIDELIEIHGDTVVIVFDLFLPSLLTGDAFRWCLQCFGNDAFAYAMPHTQRGRPNATKLRICMTERSLLVACKTIAAMLSIPTPKTSMPPAIQRVEYEPQDDIRHHLESLRVPLSVAQTERIRAAWYAITVLHADDSLHDATLSMLQSHSGRHVWILLENVSGFCVNFMNAVWNATFTEKDAASEKLIEPENTRFKVHPEATNPDDDTVGFSLRFLVLSTTHQNKRARQDSDVTDPTEQELPTNKRACNSNTAVAATEG